MKMSEIARRLDCVVEGPADPEITGLKTIEDAGPGDLTFITNKRYLTRLVNTRAGGVILGADAPEVDLPTLRSKNPDFVVAEILGWFHPRLPVSKGIHPTAVVSPTATIGPGASVGAYAVIGDDVVLGSEATIFPNVVIYRGAKIGHSFMAHAGVVVRESVEIGNRVVLQSGAVIGGDGFGYVQRPDGSVMQKPQVGTVVLGDDVEIGANSTVDRATVGTTRVGRGTKIDNLVQIGHGSEVGEYGFVCAQAGLAGSTLLGDRVQLGGQVGVAGHLKIGNDSKVVAQSGIPNDVPAGSIVGGYPAVNVLSWRRASAAMTRLPKLLTRVRTLENELEALSKAIRRGNE